MPRRYLIRALKSVVLFFVLALLLFAIAYLTSSQQQAITFWQLLEASNPWKIVIFLGVFGLVYPFIGYVTQKVARVKTLSEEDKEAVVKIFAESRYILVKDENGELVFHHTNPVARFTRIYEDAIIIDYTGNPMLVEGLRRDTCRLTRAVDWYLRKSERQAEEEANS